MELTTKRKMIGFLIAPLVGFASAILTVLIISAIKFVFSLPLSFDPLDLVIGFMFNPMILLYCVIISYIAAYFIGVPILILLNKNNMLKKKSDYIFAGIIMGVAVVSPFYFWISRMGLMILVIIVSIGDFLAYWYIAVREPKNKIELSEKSD